MQIERTTDAGFVRAVLTDPKVWPLVSDDYSMPPANFDFSLAVLNPEAFFLIPVRADGQRLGLFYFYANNNTTYQMHAALSQRGGGVWACRAAIAWMFENTRAQKIINLVVTNRPRLYRMVLAAGLELEGLNKGSLMRGGKLLDQWWMGVGKERFGHGN
jgi:RimJ/RimL family protein N-acetyltransferase